MYAGLRSELKVLSLGGVSGGVCVLKEGGVSDPREFKDDRNDALEDPMDPLLSNPFRPMKVLGMEPLL